MQQHYSCFGRHLRAGFLRHQSQHFITAPLYVPHLGRCAGFRPPPSGYLTLIELMQTREQHCLFRQTTFFCRYHRNRPASRRLAIGTAFGTCRSGTGIPPPRFAGGIGFIAPYSKDFCQSCNRLRVTAQGKCTCVYSAVSLMICAHGLAAATKPVCRSTCTN